MAPQLSVTAAFARPTSQTGSHRTPWSRSTDYKRIKRHDIARFMTANDMEIIASASSPASGITPIQEFEPVLNTQAACSFAIIAIVFTLLQLRINAVGNAAQRRSAALETLRRVESLQLSGATNEGINISDRPTEEAVLQAKLEYENALKDELDLRTVIPGVRIVAPNDPKRDEEERAAAKRFLGWGEEEFGDEPDVDADTDSIGLDDKSNGMDIQQNESSNTGLTGTAQAILFGVASMLIVLLWTLSFDPMVADQVFTTVGGSPPENMPLSSWQ